MKKVLLATLALFAPLSFADPIEGIMSFSGDITVTGDLGNNALIEFFNTETTAADRTQDFGSTIQGSLNGNFFQDISIVGGVVSTPIIPLWSVTDGVPDGSDTAFFNLLAITDYDSTGPVYSIEGTGTLGLSGFDDTAGTFVWTSQTGLLSFSTANEATGGGTTTADAPGMAALLSMGLVGLYLQRKSKLQRRV